MLRKSARKSLLRGVQTTPLFGVNVDWAELYAATYPTTADWDYLRKKRIKLVRFPIAWENIQHTLGGALDATTLASVTTALNNAAARGIKVIIDIHNYGAWANNTAWGNTVTGAGNSGITASNVYFLGDGNLTSAHLADLWTRLSTALVGHPGLGGYSIMNEPSINIVGTNIADAPNYFGTDLIASNWILANAPTITSLGDGTNPLGAGYSGAWNIQNDPSGWGGFRQEHTFTNAAHTLSLYAKKTSGSPTFYLQIAGNQSALKTPTSSWVRYSHTFTPSAGFDSFNFYFNAGSGSDNIQIANMQLELGSSATTYAPSRWTPFAQAAVNAIRAVDAGTPIYIGGLGSNVDSWQQRNYEMATMTGGGLVFDAHAYFDSSQGHSGPGTYSGTFNSYSIDVYSGVQSLAPFMTWLQSTGCQGFIGEIGVPDTTGAGDQNWLIVQKKVISFLRKNNIQATLWFYGSATSVRNDALNLSTVGAGTNDDRRLLQVLAST